MIRRSLLLSVPLLSLLAAAFGTSGCQTTRNFTTYYNLFYNIERIMDQVEEELLYIREQKAPEPTLHVAYDDALLRGLQTYNHLARRSMNADEARANKVKLDSIVIKGSKLLARSANSDYVDDAVFYMSKSFFYQREWFQSQKKAEELIANFPESDWLADAHLVMAMNLLHQGQVERSLTMLSRAIDIGWAKERLDILIDAFRLNADIHLASGNIPEALRPIERAIAISDDGADRARWQYEIGVVYFRAGDFNRAVAAFNAVGDHSPDILTQFQTGLQRAVALRALNRIDDAEEELDELRANGNFEPWRGLIDVERLNIAAARGAGDPSVSTLAAIDSATPGQAFAAYGIYERGVKAFREGEYMTALTSFQRVQSMPVPFQRKAQLFVSLLSQYYEQNHRIRRYHDYPFQPYPDSVRSGIADSYYSLARLFVRMQIPDSTRAYYDSSMAWAPDGSVSGARVLYARAAAAREENRLAEADSLLEILVQRYSLTEYAGDARRTLGYTDAAVIDPAGDLYASGKAFFRTGEPHLALKQFHALIRKYPESSYAPQAYYAVGLIYETMLDNRDSAFTYYSEILNLFPFTPQAETVRPIIDAVQTARIHSGVTQAPDGSTVVPLGTSGVSLTPDGVPRPDPTTPPAGTVPLDAAVRSTDVRVDPGTGVAPADTTRRPRRR